MARSEITWRHSPAQYDLAEGEVHVWAFPLVVPSDSPAALALQLAPAELQRASRFHFARDRDRFVAGRLCLRSILGRYLRIDPADVSFTYGPHGKPSIGEDAKPGGLRFNLAHSEDLALLALSRSALVGVDLECVRSIPDAEALVTRFFSPREAARFRTLPESHRPAAFFNLWTRKEAWLKATGEGIGAGLQRVEVSFLPGEPSRLLALDRTEHTVADWCLTELYPAPGFVGAVAVAAPQTDVQCWHWRQNAPFQAAGSTRG